MYYGETLKKYRVLPSEDRMEQFVAIIASMEDVESSEELRDMLKDGFRLRNPASTSSLLRLTLRNL